LTVDLENALMREDDGVVPGVIRPNEGVTLPLEPDGVTRPLCIDVEKDGVARPPREEATEDGRCVAPTPTVGAESLVVATKTPQLGGHVKYCLPFTVPLFLPFPENPPLSSTPAHIPDLPSIAPINRNVPSYPSDSMRTLSPTSNSLSARLELLLDTSD